MWFRLPCRLDLWRALPEGLRRPACLFAAAYLIDTIIRKTADGGTDGEGYVRLHSEVLRRVLSRRNYPAVFAALVQGGIVETSPHVAGVQATGYRLASRFNRGGVKWVRVNNGAGVRKVQAEQERLRRVQERAQQATWRPIDWVLLDMLRSL
jgi:hypothetical protein